MFFFTKNAFLIIKHLRFRNWYVQKLAYALVLLFFIVILWVFINPVFLRCQLGCTTESQEIQVEGHALWPVVWPTTRIYPGNIQDTVTVRALKLAEQLSLPICLFLPLCSIPVAVCRFRFEGCVNLGAPSSENYCFLGPSWGIPQRALGPTGIMAGVEGDGETKLIGVMAPLPREDSVARETQLAPE